MPGEVGDVATVIVPVSSDKGFCGAINSSIVREVKKVVSAGNRSNYRIFSCGEKGTTGLARPYPDLLKTAITHTASPINYPSVMAMAGQISNMAEDSDKILIIHNYFVSAIAYEQRHVELMTRSAFLNVMQYGKLYDMKLPDKNTTNTALYELYLTANLYVAFLQTIAASTSARMQAMDNASKNAGEMLDNITLQYNKARQ
jgi:F-type H+-transporting ATPase subunit gamma